MKPASTRVEAIEKKISGGSRRFVVAQGFYPDEPQFGMYRIENEILSKAEIAQKYNEQDHDILFVCYTDDWKNKAHETKGFLDEYRRL